MANLTIDLSGRNGLTPRGGEDIYKSVEEPHLRYIAGEGQMVSGVFNPFRKYGYMSPCTDSTISVTAASGSLDNELGPHTYDPGANDLYFGGDTTIWRADGLSDTSLTKFLENIGFTYTLNLSQLRFANSGSKMYLLSKTTDRSADDGGYIYEFDLSTAYDPSTLSYSGNRYNIGSIVSDPRKFQVSNDGTKLFAMDQAGGSDDSVLHEFEFDTAYDISTVFYTGNSISRTDLGNNVDNWFSFEVKPDDGTSLYCVEFDGTNDSFWSISQYDLDTAWDLSSFDNTSQSNFVTNLGAGNPSDLQFETGANDGSTIFMVVQDQDTIYEYDLSTDYDISTASADGSLSSVTDIEYIEFNDAGDEFYYFDFDYPDDNVIPYTLTAWDISTGSAGTPYSILGDDTVKVQDLALYEINGQKALYYSYNTTGVGILDNQIGVYNLETSTRDDDWLFNTANYSDISLPNEVFFEKASNGFLYAFGDTGVYRIDGQEAAGANGTAGIVLEFTGDFYIDDAEDYRENMYIAIHQGEDITNTPNYSNDVGVYVWNRLSIQANILDFIRIQGAKRVVALWTGYDGNLLCITIGANDKAQLRQLSRNSFDIVAELPRGAYPQDRNQVTRGQTASWWIGTNGNVYAYGRIGPGDRSNIYDFGQLVSESNVTYGTFFYGGGSAGSVSGDNWDEVESFYLTYEGASPTAKIWAPHANADGNFADQDTVTGDVYTPVTYLPQMSYLDHIEIYCAPTNSSASTQVGTVKVYINQDSTPFITKSVTLEDLSRGYLDYGINKKYVNSVQVEIEWEADRSLSDDNFFPSQAVLFYEPMSTEG